MRVKLFIILSFSVMVLLGCSDSKRVDPCKDVFAPPYIYYEVLNQDGTWQPDSLFTKIICLDEQVAYSSNHAFSRGSLPLDLSDDETTYVFYHANMVDTLTFNTTHDLELSKHNCGFIAKLTNITVSYSTFANQVLTKQTPNSFSQFGITSTIKIYP